LVAGGIALLDVALDYAEQGWRVLALVANKKIPINDRDLQPNGSLSATADADHIRELWEKYPDANIGVATGEASGLTVIDLDGQEAQLALDAAGLTIPATYMVRTRKGYHLYLQYDQDVRQTARILDMVDIRNDGGYVVAPPSTVDGFDYLVQAQDPVGTWPEFAAHIKEVQMNGSAPAPGQVSANQPGWVENLLEHGSPAGRRNEDGTRLVGFFRRMNLQVSLIRATVKRWADKCTPPLPDDELDLIIQSVSRYKAQAPKTYQGQTVSLPLVQEATVRKKVLHFVDEGVKITCDRIRADSRSGVTCWLYVETSTLGRIYGPATFNPLAARSTVRRELQDRDEQDWGGILNAVSTVIVEGIDESAELIDVTKHVASSDLPWLLEPYLREGAPTLIYGDGGEGKSTWAIAALLSLVTDTKVLPGVTVHKTGAVLYLDWEDEADSFTRSVSAVAAGAGITVPAGKFLYLRMAGPLEHQVDMVEKYITDHGVIAVVADSLVAAAGGDVNESEAARMYFGAMRQFGVASIGITHMSKDKKNNDKPFGSVYYWNYARAVWFMQKVQESGDNESEIALFHKKANASDLQVPRSYKVDFSNDQIKYLTANIQSTPKFAKQTGARAQVIGVLHKGSKTLSEISEETGLKSNTVANVLSRGTKHFTRVVGGGWGLLTNLPDTAVRPTPEIDSHSLPPKGESVSQGVNDINININKEDEPW
jgi:lambda repressor-like predicted transcriptional regulator